MQPFFLLCVKKVSEQSLIGKNSKTFLENIEEREKRKRQVGKNQRRHFYEAKNKK